MDNLPDVYTPAPVPGEMAAMAAAAQAKAMVESRYVMAMRNPRNWDQVRLDVLKECSRPSFAHNKSAFYRKPIGQGVEGLGIRFVEVALRCMKNVLIEIPMVHEDDRKEVFRVSVTDLENNITYPMDVKVSKTVERSKPAEDGSFISVRKNSYGKDVYTVPANDDDLLNKRLAMISKAIRTLGLRVIPGDIQDEAEATILKIRKDAAAKDPDGERKKICDAFAAMGVKATSLAEYLGHDIAQSSPQELVDLRGLYGAIRDGEATWRSVMESRGLDADTKDEGKKSLNDRFKTQEKPDKGKAETPPPAKNEPSPVPEASPDKIFIFKAEIDLCETAAAVDQWRSKHNKRVDREFVGDDAGFTAVMSYANDRYEALSAQQS